MTRGQKYAEAAKQLRASSVANTAPTVDWCSTRPRLSTGMTRRQSSGHTVNAVAHSVICRLFTLSCFLL